MPVGLNLLDEEDALFRVYPPVLPHFPCGRRGPLVEADVGEDVEFGPVGGFEGFRPVIPFPYGFLGLIEGWVLGRRMNRFPFE